MIIFFEISFKQLFYLAVKIIISFLHNIHEENPSKINRQLINARNYICMWEVFCGKIQNHEIREIICPKHLISLFTFTVICLKHTCILPCLTFYGRLRIRCLYP